LETIDLKGFKGDVILMYLIDTNVISAAGEGFEELDIAI